LLSPPGTQASGQCCSSSGAHTPRSQDNVDQPHSRHSRLH
jgi:hypothetical protein